MAKSKNRLFGFHHGPIVIMVNHFNQVKIPKLSRECAELSGSNGAWPRRRHGE
jgi:hypothetical protein